jgi:hypothetical protein
MPWVYVNQTSTSTIGYPPIQYPMDQTTSITQIVQPVYFYQNVTIPQSLFWTNQVNPRYQHWVTGSGDWEPEMRRRPEPRIEIPRQSRTQAFEKAKELLLTHLNEEQRKTFRERGLFIIEGGRSKAKYQIQTEGIVANVKRLTDNQKLCAHLECQMPLYDHILAQKLMLEYDEDSFLAIANRH